MNWPLHPRNDTRKPRALVLTDDGLAAIGAPARPVLVPLLDLPWRDDRRDRKPDDREGHR